MFFHLYIGSLLLIHRRRNACGPPSPSGEGNERGASSLQDNSVSQVKAKKMPSPFGEGKIKLKLFSISHRRHWRASALREALRRHGRHLLSALVILDISFRLCREELAILLACRHKLGMSSNLNDCAVLKNDYLIGGRCG